LKFAKKLTNLNPQVKILNRYTERTDRLSRSNNLKNACRNTTFLDHPDT